jgi:O-antigen/teichoic acid export membrane protein
MSDNITAKAKSSIFWSAIEKLSTNGMNFIITIVLSRFLLPSDYGLIAMLYVFIDLSNRIIEGGLSTSLIQNQQRTEKDFSTVFYLNIAVGVLCYLVLYVSAPFISDFYHQPALVDLLRVYSLVLIITSLTLVQTTRLYIEFKFRQLSVIRFCTTTLGGTVGIVMAYYGFGAWSLVTYYIVLSVSYNLLACKITRWHPQLIFSIPSAKRAISFGWKLLSANVINCLVSNLYTLIIGRKYTSTDLGYYSRGRSISYVYPSTLSGMISQSLYPVLCELQSEKEELKRMFSSYVRMAAIVSFPLMTILLALAKPIVSVVLTDNWLPAVPFIQILAIGYMFEPISRINETSLSITGKTKISLQSEIVKRITLLIILFATLPFGIMWLTIGVAIYSFCDLFIVSLFTRKVINISQFEQLRILLPYLVYCAISYVAMTVVVSLVESAVLQLCIGVPIGLLVYLGLSLTFSRRYLQSAIRILKRK